MLLWITFTITVTWFCKALLEVLNHCLQRDPRQQSQHVKLRLYRGLYRVQEGHLGDHIGFWVVFRGSYTEVLQGLLSGIGVLTRAHGGRSCE